MTFAVMQVEALRLLSLEILRAAVAAAADGDPLKNLYIPKHRFEKLDPKQAPWLHVVGISDGGPNLSHELPRIDSQATLHFNLLCASGRDDAADLDTQAWTLGEAIALQILESQAFLKAIRWVEDFRPKSEDGQINGGEYDVVMLQLELVVAVGPVQFEPREGSATVQIVQIGTKLGPDNQSIEGQSLTVKEQFPVGGDD